MKKVCPACGQPVYELKDFEKRLGKPLLWLFEQYEIWKDLNEKNEGLKKNESEAISK